MNPNHLTPNVRKQVVLAVEAQREMMREKNAKGIQKAFEGKEEVDKFFNPFYEKVKDEVDNNFGEFMDLCILEFKHGFVGGFLGGAVMNEGDESITINIK